MAKKGQAALEYLTTYGWLLVIIVIVAGALYALGVFSPATYQGKTCTGFSSQITYSDHKLADDGTFTLVLSNNIGKSIAAVPNVAMTLSGGAVVNDASTGVAVPWTPGAKRTLALTGPDGGSIGDSYSMTVTATYDTAEIAGHKQTGTCTGTVE